MVWLGSGSDARHTGRISFVAWMVVCAAILVNKLVVLALHRGEEALVDHVAVGAKLASRLRLAGQVLGGLVPGPIRLNGVLLSVLLAYRLLEVIGTLAGWPRVRFVQDEAVLAQHVLIGDGRVEGGTGMRASRVALGLPTLNVSELCLARGHPTHVGVPLRHLVRLRLSIMLLLLHVLVLKLLVVLNHGLGRSCFLRHRTRL